MFSLQLQSSCLLCIKWLICQLATTASNHTSPVNPDPIGPNATSSYPPLTPTHYIHFPRTPSQSSSFSHLSNASLPTHHASPFARSTHTLKTPCSATQSIPYISSI